MAECTDVFVVDGTADDGTFQGDGEHPPFVIFNVTQQKNLQPYYATRKQAEEALAKLINPSV